MPSVRIVLAKEVAVVGAAGVVLNVAVGHLVLVIAPRCVTVVRERVDSNLSMTKR